MSPKTNPEKNSSHAADTGASLTEETVNVMEEESTFQVSSSGSIEISTKQQQEQEQEQQQQQQQQQDEWDDNGEEEEDMTDAFEPQQRQQEQQNFKEEKGTSSSLNPHQSHYHPFLLPSDQSLLDARTRLHTALEQTRILRETFTKRLWDKYNIKMTPVESSIETIVERCLSETALSEIQQTQNIWSWEKRIEGIVDPPLIPMLTGVSSALPSGAGGGSGGFSSVILPEDEDYFSYDNHNASSNKRISGASAAAAKIILERARANAVARSYVFSDKDKSKYGNNGPIAVCLKSSDVARLIQQKKMHSLLKKRRGVVASAPRGGAVQLQPNTNVGVMGSEVLSVSGPGAVTIVPAPNLPIILFEEEEEKDLKSTKTTSNILTVPLDKSTAISTAAAAAAPLHLAAATSAMRKVGLSYDTISANESAAVVAAVVMPKSSNTTVPPEKANNSTMYTANYVAATIATTSSTPIARTATSATGTVAATSKPSYPQQNYQKRAPNSGNTSVLQQPYGIDLALDETLILFHKSGSSYKTKILRHLAHSHHTIPSLTSSWSLITCQRLLSFEKNNNYFAARMGLRDAFIKRHLLPKMLEQHGGENSNVTTDSAHLLPPPWKWIENSSHIVVKEGTCILPSTKQENQDIARGIGRVLDVFYTESQKDSSNTPKCLDHIAPVAVNNVALAYAMKFSLSNNIKLPQQEDQTATNEEKDTSSANNNKSSSLYDCVTVYSVLVALGVIKTINSSFDNEVPPIDSCSTLAPSLPKPKFIEGQRVEALWQSPHEAHFSGASTPYSSDAEMMAPSSAGFSSSATSSDIALTTRTRTAVSSKACRRFTIDTVTKASAAIKGSWYPAVVTRAVYKPHIVDGFNFLGPEGNDYRYDVAYDDGDIDEGLKVYQIRASTALIDSTNEKLYHDTATTADTNVEKVGGIAVIATESPSKRNHIINSASESIVLSYRSYLHSSYDPSSLEERLIPVINNAPSCDSNPDINERPAALRAAEMQPEPHIKKRQPALDLENEAASSNQQESLESSKSPSPNLNQEKCLAASLDKASELVGGESEVLVPSKAKRARISSTDENENCGALGTNGDFVQKSSAVTENINSSNKIDSKSVACPIACAVSPVVALPSTDTSSNQSSNIGVPFWRQAAHEAADLEQALKWHAASMVAAPSPFAMFPSQQNQTGFSSMGYSNLSNLPGSSGSLAHTQLMYAAGNNDLRRSSGGGQVFPFAQGITGMADTYTRALALNSNNGANTWDRPNTLFQNTPAVGLYQMEQHHSLVGARGPFLFGAPRTMMTLPAMHAQAQAQQHAAAQMQQFLMSSPTKWAPSRPHTAHAFSPTISSTTTSAINPTADGVTQIGLLRPSSAGPLTSQTIATGIAGSTHNSINIESMANYQRIGALSTKAPISADASNSIVTNAVEPRESKDSYSFQSINPPGRPSSAPETLGRSSPAASVAQAYAGTLDSCPPSSKMNQQQLEDEAHLELSDDKKLRLAIDKNIVPCRAPSLPQERSDATKHCTPSSRFHDCVTDSVGHLANDVDLLATLPSESIRPATDDVAQTSLAVNKNMRASPSSELDIQNSNPLVIESLLAQKYPSVARLIEMGKFPLTFAVFLDQKEISEMSVSEQGKDRLFDSDELENAAVDYLLQVGNNVPVVRTWVVHEIKKKWTKFTPLSLLAFNGKNCSLSTIREVLSAVVSLWVWHNYRPVFQRVSTTKGRMDIDSKCNFFHECNFIVEACVESCLLGIAKEIVAVGGLPFNPSLCFFSSATIAGIASFVLDAGVSLSPEMDCLLLPSNLEVELADLDKRRFKALQLMIYERVLLTSFVARTMIMTEKYAYAYLKFMLVVGETLGHAKVCQMVNDDTLYDPWIVSAKELSVSLPHFSNGSIWSFLPFDVVRSEDDELGYVLEDPCKPRHGGFTQGMDKNELISRAHAKALMQRCLYKLQQKYGFQGGTNNAGLYGDHETSDVSAQPRNSKESMDSIQHIPPSVAGFGVPLTSPASSSSRGGHPTILKRKSSFTGREIDATGGASHVGALMYPAHYCAPLVVHSHDVTCMPYGKHTIVRCSASETDENVPALHKKPRQEEPSPVSSILRSTDPIDWCEVAKLFQPVAVPDQAVQAGSVEQVANIFAPDVRKLEGSAWDEYADDSDYDDDSECEDISDEAILARHQEVLDVMKQKLDVAMEQRNQSRGRANISAGGPSRIVR